MRWRSSVREATHGHMLARVVMVVVVLGFVGCNRDSPSASECRDLQNHLDAMENPSHEILQRADGSAFHCADLTRAQLACVKAATSREVAGKCEGLRVGHRTELKEGCPCGCDRSEALVAELRSEAPDDAKDAIEATLDIIGERERGGYITEAMVEHRLRLLDLRRELGAGGVSPRFESAVFRDDDPVTENAALRVRTELMAHGRATELVRGREKEVRASFRLGMEIENLSGTKLTLGEPTLEGRVGLPVSRWYVVGTAGERWDGVLEAGDKKSVNVIGYLAEPVPPGTDIDATIQLEGLVMHAHARARRHWKRE